MFLWEGRTVCWKGKKVVIVQRIDKKYVMVALASRQYMKFMVKREDITPKR